jgi:hypothetical protein
MSAMRSGYERNGRCGLEHSAPIFRSMYFYRILVSRHCSLLSAC